MLFNKNKKSGYLLGIDLTDTTIKILELSKRKQHYHIENHIIVPLENNNKIPIDTLLQNDISAVKNILSEQLHKTSFNTTNVAIAISDNNILNKIIRFDKSCTASEIENQIAVDHMKYFSPITEPINYDFYHLGQSRQYPDCVDVWITGVKQALVNNCSKLFSESQLHIVAFDIASLAIARACQLIPDIVKLIDNNQLFAVININRLQATLTIYHHYAPLLIRTISLSHIEEIENTDFSAMVPLNSQKYLTQQLHQIMDSFQSSYNADSIKQLLICGDISNIVALSRHLNAEFNIPCSVANPLSKISFADHCDSQTILQQAHRWMICCGLAMRTRD